MQTIDAEISRQKFDQEVAAFLAGQDVQRKRGIYLLKADFPNIIASFAAHKLQPPPIVFVVRINYDNYDLEPLSVRFIHPFTWEDLTQLPTQLIRKIPEPDGKLNMQPQAFVELNCKPMICLPGIREYHEHPAHTGDSWLLHRGKGGEGSLGFIVEKLYDYGIGAIQTYQVTVQAQAQIMQLAYDLNLLPE